MRTFDWYMFRNLLAMTLVVAVTLTVVVLLTQSLRFLELVVESGASSVSFWILTFLALPRFFEVILPIALLAASVFVYNRMTMDSELVVMRGVGYSPAALARPAVVLAMLVTVFLWCMTFWTAPRALAEMQQMRQTIKSQLATLLFHEGVFNQPINGLTVYVRERSGDGELRGLMIHDSRDQNANAATVMAKRGVLVAQEDGSHQVLVYDGSRHEYDTDSDTLHRLNFERYTIDLPDAGPVRQRWREPDERTIGELLSPDRDNPSDMNALRDFRVEIHRRIISPLQALAFTLVACAALLLGPVDRRGQGRRIALAVGIVILLQGLSLAAFNMARQSDLGLALIYILIVLPCFIAGGALMGWSERFRRRILYRGPEQAGGTGS